MSINLPILNYAFALNQLGGNAVLLSKMLGKFVAEFVQVSSEVRAALDKNDHNSAKIKVHTVKGISGNLGLQALYDCASRFDVELRKGLINEATVLEFTQIVSDTCIEIQKLEKKETPVRAISAATLPPETVKIELIERLKRNEFIDDDTLFKMVSNLGLSDASAKNLIGLIEDLQYPEAIVVIQETP